MNVPALSRLIEHLCEGASEAKIAAVAARYSMDVAVVRLAAEADPSSNGAFTEWLARHMKAGALRFPEDGDKMRDQLVRFSKLKAKSTYRGEKDLNRLDPGALWELLQQHGDTVGKKERVRMAVDSGMREVTRKGKFVVMEVTTPEAGAELFRSTNWCVKDPKYFDTYGPPFYMVSGDDGTPKALYHPKSGDFNNAADKPIPVTGVYRAVLAAAGLPHDGASVLANMLRWKRYTPTPLEIPALRLVRDAVLVSPVALPYAERSGEWWAPELADIALRYVDLDSVENVVSASYYARIMGRRYTALEPALLDAVDAILAGKASPHSLVNVVYYAAAFMPDGWPELEGKLRAGAQEIRDGHAPEAVKGDWAMGMIRYGEKFGGPWEELGRPLF